MQMSTTCVNDLEARYIAVFRGLRENRNDVPGMTSPLDVVLGPCRLKRCLQRLDTYAEDLRRLDEDLMRITDVREAGDTERFDCLSKYSELLELGGRVYNTLYREYKEVRTLRETLNFVLLAATAGVVVAGALLLLL